MMLFMSNVNPYKTILNLSVDISKYKNMSGNNTPCHQDNGYLWGGKEGKQGSGGSSAIPITLYYLQKV